MKTDSKPTECMPCVYWRRNGCDKNQPGFPTIGPFCISYSREAGSDDDIGEEEDE